MVDVEKLVSTIVEGKWAIFKQQLELDLLPIKLAIKTHEEQITEIRASNTALGHGQARMEGKIDVFFDTQQSNHSENAKKTDELIKLFHAHIGEHSGQEKHEDAVQEQDDRTSDKRRAWFKIALGVGTSGGVIKYVHDHWTRFHLK